MDYVVEISEVPVQPAAVVKAYVEATQLPQFFGPAFGEVLEAVGRQGRAVTGPPFGRYIPRDGGFDVTAGFPVDGAVTAAGRVTPDELPGGTVATTLHVGGYDAVAAAYEAATTWLEQHDLAVTGVPWESYLDGPEVPEPRTRVCVPCGPRS
ncbi:GyrI-like domain-containing protein [Cumulibacter manganitolerans]|uniref:GyrI-like domain-containing protein n=1 Tax=Cumulibacter manganitolerans TaxID=1884992 RepID=UPI001297E87E|nr:GyrI-like domain-containing protein [Cumulibacter manganitolerans]